MASYHGAASMGSGSSSSSNFQFMSSQFGDTTYTKVFVGGLAWETKSEAMRRYFEQFGEILEAVVISDKNTSRSKGYGFVTFREPEAARRACFDSAPIIDGRRTNCNLASLGRPRSSLPYGRLRSVVPPYINTGQSPAMPFFAGYGFQHPIPYNYQHQAFIYHPSYGYAPEPGYSPQPQGSYNPYMGQQQQQQQQYLQLYNMAARGMSTPIYYPHLPHHHHPFSFPPPHLLPFNLIPTPHHPQQPPPPSSIQPPLSYPPQGIVSPVPAQQFVFHTHPQFIPGTGSEQSSG